MHGFLKGTRLLLSTPMPLIVVALAACAPAYAPEATPASNALPTKTVLWTDTPTPAPDPAPTSTETPVEPTPTPTSTPVLAVTITYIKMIDMTGGWAEGQVGTEEASRILRTTDGGGTWRDVSPVIREGPYGSFFLDAQLAWVWTLYGHEMWRTQDGGDTWVSVATVGGQPEIWFNDSQRGWKMEATHWGLSYVQFDIDSFGTTQDGGQTWQETNPPPGRGSAFMAYPDALMAWAVRAGFAKTQEGYPNLVVPFFIEWTSDGGMAWTFHAMPLPPEAFPVEPLSDGYYFGGVGNCDFVSPVYSSTAIWKLALTCEGRSWMYTTANRGKTWIISPMPAGLDADIQFIDPTIGWLFLRDPLDTSEGRLYQTEDGGQDWTLIKRTRWADAQLDFLDAQRGWAVVCSDAWYCYEDDAIHALVRTTDGGQTWQILQPQIAP